MNTPRRVLPLLPLALGACGTSTGSDAGSADPNAPTYYRDAKVIIDARCASCHQDGDIGPFPLTTYDEVTAFSTAILASIEGGTMPPWQPSDDCREYVGSIDLTDDERETLLAWLEAGAVEGDPADAPAEDDAEAPPSFEPDITVQLPEPYTPTKEPDDYRCQLIPWPAQETRYVTGLRVTPDQRSIVHHTIVFLAGPDQVEQFQAYDDAEEGPGYTCYGGPTGGGGGGGGVEGLDAFRPLGSWVPGTPNLPYPAGTGLRVEPGSMLVVQMHYNTLSSAPVPDQSTVEFTTAEAVEREAVKLIPIDLGWVTNGLLGEPMTIPAGEAHVEHSTTAGFDSMMLNRARTELGLGVDAPLVLYDANHHMHQLGTSQRSEVRHEDGSATCLLDIPEWDFNWQGSYQLAEPVTIRPGDELWMGCTWDNSASNQPVIDGEVREPADVVWGEGTTDEMCLASYYVTRE